MIKNIIFDMGGVLINWNPTQFMREAGLSEQDITLLNGLTFKNYKWTLMDAGYFGSDEAFLEFILKDVPERLHKVLSDIVLDFGREVVETLDGMPDLVRTLKRNGYGIYLLSNAGYRHPDYWQHVDSHECFDGVVVSAHVRMIKPEKRIYDHILEKYDLKASECVFVDDLPINCAGAYIAGITPVNFKSREQLIESLEKLGVNCH